MTRRSFWDRVAKRFDTPAPTSDEDEAVRRSFEHLQPKHHVLEIGCAAGATAEALRPQVASWHGIDISEEMIRRAQTRDVDATFEVGTVADAAGTFDAVVAFNVLHFMELPGDLRRIHDLLAPGGLLLAQTPCLGDMPWYLRGVFPVIAFVLRVPGLHRLRFADLRRHVTGSGFTMVEHEADGPSHTWLVARRD